MLRNVFGASVVAVGLAVLVVACGGSSSSPTSPSPTPAPGGGGSGSGTIVTVTITSAGVNPASVQVPMGGRVTFVNNDSVFHEESSNPHPVHTDCPEINAVGLLAAGQSGTTGAFNTARSCGYHDHLNDTDSRFKGTIVIQ